MDSPPLGSSAFYRQRFESSVFGLHTMQPPPEVAAERTQLLERAAKIVADLKPQTWTRRGDAPSETPEPVDCSVEGSGFLSLYYLGVHSVASRCVRIVRYAGASSGGFTTTVLPVARATATFLVAMSSGWFHGVISPHTPSGRRLTATHRATRTSRVHRNKRAEHIRFAGRWRWKDESAPLVALEQLPPIDFGLLALGVQLRERERH